MKVSSLIVRTELEEHLNWIFYIRPKILQLCKQPNSRTEKLMFIFLFCNYILLWTALYSSGGHESKAECLLCRWRWWLLIPWQEFPNVVPIDKDRMCSCSGSSLESDIQWGSLNAPVAPAQVCNPCLWKHCDDRGSFVSKAWLGCSFDVVADLLLFPMLCLFFLSLSPELALSSI